MRRTKSSGLPCELALLRYSKDMHANLVLDYSVLLCMHDSRVIDLTLGVILLHCHDHTQGRTVSLIVELGPYPVSV